MTNTSTHENRVAVVTGAGRGIGAAIAKALAERGSEDYLSSLVGP